MLFRSVAYAQTRDHAVNGGDDGRFAQHVGGADLLRAPLADAARRGLQILAAAVHGGAGRGELCLGGVGSGGSRVQFGRCDQLFGAQLATPLEYLRRISQASFGRRSVGLRSADLLRRRPFVRLERLGLLGRARSVALCLHAIDLRQHLSGSHPVAFGHR